jgi:hypothetical protein
LKNQEKDAQESVKTTKLSDAQVKGIDSLILGESVNGNTLKSLKSRGLVNKEGLVTQDGLKFTSLPTQEVDVITFGKDVIYTGTFTDEDKRTWQATYNFPKGTEMLVVSAIPNKKYRAVYEGIIVADNKKVRVTMYRHPHFKLEQRLFPVVEDEDVSDS